jgi:hypothetical protein
MGLLHSLTQHFSLHSDPSEEQVSMQATEKETAQALHAFVSTKPNGCVLATEIHQFYAPHGERYRHIFTGRTGAAQAFVRRWPAYFSLVPVQPNSHNLLLRAQRQPGPAASPAVPRPGFLAPAAPQAVPQAALEEAARALAAFVRVQGGSMLTANISQFYAAHPGRFSHLFRGKGTVQAFVQSWPQFFTLEDVPGVRSTTVIKAVPHVAPQPVSATAAAQVAVPDVPRQAPQAVPVAPLVAITAPHVVPSDSAAFLPLAPYAITTKEQSARIGEVQSLLDVLHPDLLVGLLERPAECHRLRDITIDIGRCVAAYTSQPDQRAALPRVVVTQEHLNYALENIGLETFGSDDRAGLSHTLHRISALRSRQGNIIGLTMRVGRALIGIASMIADILKSNQSILILGEPGSGMQQLHRVIQLATTLI